MPSLTSLRLKPSYRKGVDDIAQDFYIPCMHNATSFDRAVGFFSSSIYSIAWEALVEFIKNGGHIRVVCSPVLSPEDIHALSQGYDARPENILETAILTELDALFSSRDTVVPATVLASLVAIGRLDVKVATMIGAGRNRGPIFHDKLGLFHDSESATVAFKGSMNETWLGLSSDGNLESVDVFVSWSDEREAQRVKEAIKDFDDLWNNRYPTVDVRTFPDAAAERLLREARPDDWQQMVDEIVAEARSAQSMTADRKLGGRKPMRHQIEALEEWTRLGRRGILEHATGSGKTFTALCAIRESVLLGEAVLVLVPSELLLKQWRGEIEETLADLVPSILLVGAGNSDWRTQNLLPAFTRARSEGLHRITVAMMQSAATEEFLATVKGSDKLFVVADEVHRIGSTQHRRSLQIPSGPRLGLSATPYRYGDPEGTAAILEYFGPVIQPPFTLNDAIAAGTLTPYFYHPHGVRLTNVEQEAWDKLSSEIGQLVARRADEQVLLSERIRNLLIKRARIIKGAQNKIGLVMEVLEHHFQQGNRWLIYCDSVTQLSAVLQVCRSAGYDAREYHSAMQGDKEATLSYFQDNGGVLVSIKCLDEGVDIPAVDSALVLASSKNPREFIQRRGRVLRRFPGKYFSHVHDAITLPAELHESDSGSRIVMGELARAIEFGRSSLNPSSIDSLAVIAAGASVDISSLRDAGLEGDANG